jgi:hypothetical protein
VLQSGERVSTYRVPIAGELPYDRLRGDVRPAAARAQEAIRLGRPRRR